MVGWNFKTFIQTLQTNSVCVCMGVDVFCCCVIKFILLSKMCGLRVLQQWSSGSMVNTNWKDNLLSMAHILYKYHLLFGGCVASRARKKKRVIIAVRVEQDLEVSRRCYPHT